jgi:hypothetical protein
MGSPMETAKEQPTVYQKVLLTEQTMEELTEFSIVVLMA